MEAYITLERYCTEAILEINCAVYHPEEFRVRSMLVSIWAFSDMHTLLYLKHDNAYSEFYASGDGNWTGNHCLIIPRDAVGQEFRQGKLGMFAFAPQSLEPLCGRCEWACHIWRLLHSHLQYLGWCISCPVVSSSAVPWTVAHQAPLSTAFSRQNTRVGSHSLLQGIFLTQRSSPGLLHWRQILHHLNHQRRPHTCDSKTELSWDRWPDALYMVFPHGLGTLIAWWPLNW